MVLLKNVKNFTKHYDIIVIGAGAGLGKLGRPATEYGYSVALCENDKLGGTCLNRGCIPSKMLIHPADVVQTIESAHRFEVDVKKKETSGDLDYDIRFSELVARVSKTIDDESDSILPNVEKNQKLDWFVGQTARFIGERTLQVGSPDDNVVITADRVFVAAGARAVDLSDQIEGLASTPYMTYREALRNQQRFKRLICIGAGYIATELCHFFSSTGTHTTLFVRSKFLKYEDEEVQKEFERVFVKRKNIEVKQGMKPIRVRYENNEFILTYLNPHLDTAQEQEIRADALLVAAGVKPNTDILQCEKAGIKLTKDGFVEVDKYLRSVSAPNVWALGDIAGNYLFRHNANFESEYLMETVISKMSEPYPIDHTGMPHAVFANPQIAGVGLTEQECREKGLNFVSVKNNYSASAMGMALLSDEGFVKLIVERGTRRILGCHIIGHEASTLVHQVGVLFRIEGGAKLDDLLNCIYIHPALNEIVRNAARKAKQALLNAGDTIPPSLYFK
ncbi:hypothetical protein C9374_010801 [Naegleria lovaniensis]|uniref:Dihydrolipoyl dehydrogenase n=1 Tax=Naegleria lovaniensis TaxID=51637 RepID=A0AA88GF88_NAELO|nr:uncharacterized protein C9374_010801 [Naegleria lovaniensis]KAG2374517.1 hypothetical protein C9374_010801 [Naegleria lovaniensis]